MTDQERIREKPTCLAIIICNEVIEDKRTNNKTLVGLFNQILVHQVPAMHQRLFVMASFTDARGDWPVIFRITSPSGKAIVHIGNTVTFSDPLSVSDLIIEVRDLPLEEEGVYDVDFLFENDPRAHRHFTVTRTLPADLASP